MVPRTYCKYSSVTLLNVSTHNATWPDFAEMLCKRFGYDKISAMVTGAEGADTACKVARKWGTQVKGIASQEVLVLGVSDNYHGLSSGVWPLMNPDQSRIGKFAFNVEKIAALKSIRLCLPQQHYDQPQPSNWRDLTLWLCRRHGKMPRETPSTCCRRHHGMYPWPISVRSFSHCTSFKTQLEHSPEPLNRSATSPGPYA